MSVIGTPGPPPEFAPENRSRALAPVIGERALRVLVGLLEELRDPCHGVRLAWTPDGCLRAEAPGLTFVARQMAGRFPRWREVFPPPSPQRGHWSRSDRLLAILKQAKALTDRDCRAMRLGFRPGAITLTVRKEEGGVTTFETHCEYRSEPASADFDPVRLIDVLSVLKGETVDLELNGPGIPVVLHAAGLRYCVMPLPVEEEGEAARESEGEPGADERPANDEEAAPEVQEECTAPAEPATTA